MEKYRVGILDAYSFIDSSVVFFCHLWILQHANCICCVCGLHVMVSSR